MRSSHHRSPGRKRKDKEKTLVFTKALRVKSNPGKDKQGSGNDYTHEK